MPGRKLRLETLHKDPSFLVLDKTGGLLSIPDRYDSTLPSVLSMLDGTGAIPVHRLDRDTSGVIVFALSEEAHRSLNKQFAERSVEKYYHAVVQGEPAEPDFEIDEPILSDQGRAHKSIIDRRGKKSRTKCRLVERLGPFSIVEAKPLTGRTHQVRVHLASVGLPIVADSLYGDGRPFLLSEVKRSYTPGKHDERPLLGRLGLHAARLTFDHPDTGGRLEFEAEYPKDFRASITQLRKLFG